MLKRVLLSAAALGFSTSIAVAGGHTTSNTGMNGDYFFGQIDYSFNLNTEFKPEDGAPTYDAGSDEHDRAYTGGYVDDFDSSWGVGLGYRYANNTAAILRYEEASFESTGTLGIVDVNGVVGSLPLTEYGDTDITNMMLEAAYYVPINEKIEFFVMGGVGRAEIETTDAYITDSDSGLVVRAVCGDQETNTSYRIGAGGTFAVSHTTGFYGGLTYTNYGDLAGRDTDENTGDTCAGRSTSQDTDIESQDLRIGYYIRF